MLEKKLTQDEVIAIRKNWNPVKAFAHGYTHGDLENKSYLEIVDIFNKRISEWYFDTAKSFKKNNNRGVTHYNFPIIVFCSILIDLLSQYIYGEPVHRDFRFKQFFREYLKKYNIVIKPPIISCTYKFKNKQRAEGWYKEEIKDFADAYYHCFRSGVVHAGRILEYGRINEYFPRKIIKIRAWGKNQREINIHTTALLKKLREIFDDYITELKMDNIKLKKNFIKKLKFEYGIVITN